MKEAKHCVAFTGAGISTSANIPDFRGPRGVWTQRERGGVSKGKNVMEAVPTFAHYAITELVKRGLIKFVITTNMDCLHIRSGLPRHLIIEQHGNVNKEVCVNCGTQHWRSYETTSTVLKTRDHYTCRYCNWCGGKLRDTIVHFSENWSEEHTEALSLHHSRKCDLALIMGTSMNVQPNATFPEECLKKTPPGKMVLVNLQKTPYDHVVNMRVFSKTDNFMFLLMKELGIENFESVQEDIRDQWDKMTEQDMDRYYETAYGVKRKNKKKRNNIAIPTSLYLAASLLLSLSVVVGVWYKNK
uniref:Deacetylase sirtuin-type domain-containing protein n=1 Tax=Arcella intermedia TaxID=1963864 RepID=A0A6B2LAT8_9EUKA